MSQSNCGDSPTILNKQNGSKSSDFAPEPDYYKTGKQLTPTENTYGAESDADNTKTTFLNYTLDPLEFAASPVQSASAVITPSERKNSPNHQLTNSVEDIDHCDHSIADNESLVASELNESTVSNGALKTRAFSEEMKENHSIPIITEDITVNRGALNDAENGHLIDNENLDYSKSTTVVSLESPNFHSAQCVTSSHDTDFQLELSIPSQVESSIDNGLHCFTEDVRDSKAPLTDDSSTLSTQDDFLSPQKNEASEVSHCFTSMGDTVHRACVESTPLCSSLLDSGRVDFTRQTIASTTSVQSDDEPTTFEHTGGDMFITSCETQNTSGIEPQAFSSTVKPLEPIPLSNFGSTDSAFKRVSTVASPENLNDSTSFSQETQANVLLSTSFSTTQRAENNYLDPEIHPTNQPENIFPVAAPGDHAVIPSPLRFVDQSTNFGRFSPAQVVAATGGAPVEILRQIENANECSNIASTPSHTDCENIAGGHRTLTNSRRGSVSLSSSLNESCDAIPPVINIHLRVNASLTPTSPDVVAASSEVIFGNFLAESYRMEVATSAKVSTGTRAAEASASAYASVGRSNLEPSSSQYHIIPVEPDTFGSEFAAIPQSAPGSMEAMVAHNLALIGDEINRTYGARLDNMIKILPVDECPLEIFSNVARVLFSRGPTNWGQVVALFCFGYRLVIRRVYRGLANAFFQVCKCIISFCRQMNVFAWIAAQGGWRIVQYLTCRRNSEAFSEDVQSVNDEGLVHRGSSFTSLLPSNWTDPSMSPTVMIVGLIALCSAVLIYRRLSH